jgi:hypothetical protein
MPSQRSAHKQILFPDEVVLRTDLFRVAQDWEVPIKGFYVIASIRPRRSIIDLDQRELIQLVRLQYLVRESMKTVLGISDAYFFQNEDSDHGFHVWVFPRHAWMDKIAGRKIQSVRPIMDYATRHCSKRTLDEIRAANNSMREYFEYLPVDDYLRHDLLNEQEAVGRNLRAWKAVFNHLPVESKNNKSSAIVSGRKRK